MILYIMLLLGITSLIIQYLDKDVSKWIPITGTVLMLTSIVTFYIQYVTNLL